MKIVVLSDNRTQSEALQPEHGLCIYLETNKYTCLLDTGASDLFIHNAEKTGVDIQAVDFVFISHGHADHIGGLPAFLAVNNKAKIVLSKNAISQSFFSSRNGLHPISLDFDFSPYAERFIFVNTEMVLSDEIHVFSVNVNKDPLPKTNTTLFKQTENGLISDDFDHELVISFGTDNLFVYTGCAHKGLLNILSSISLSFAKKIETVMGGFHLPDSKSGQEFETIAEIEDIGSQLQKIYPDTHFITGHCSGEKAFKLLKTKLGEHIDLFYTGYSRII
jgi:7,8-dihydropterin-6-yl-methyl-4-(beta-D-ribofuranosyl)aminobenzene 5'-phosphate synthase